jgi:carbamoyl-phosphate synthase small subunit
MEQGYLILETGEHFQGQWHVGEDRAGEVVFNTSHSGYEEVATDPSYFRQIVCLTAPMQGNYGVDDTCWESKQIWIEGFLALQIQNSSRDKAWRDRLSHHKIPLMTDFDTRKLVIRLRSGGTPWGALVRAKTLDAAKARATELIAQKKNLDKDWVFQVSRKSAEIRKGRSTNSVRLAVLDFGVKENILRELEARCSEMKIFNSRASVQDIEAYAPHGLMLTNGPGDPGDVQSAVQTVQHFLGKRPVFGICMGHQILGLALGGKTFKLKFGHRGSNHPIQDKLLNKIYISSQNHGYAVDPNTLPAHVAVTQINLNDKTVAGFYSEELNCLGIQYHPESHPGPHEAVELFDFYLDVMIRKQF